ncbi:cytochrome oxidase putative small subunit CydP [Rhodanobacter sp. L36]|uniref:cytochrome oxidase putative small subunit CydP n=1 Tax=Rhodanobacter sp. L36 TaxID=1747221 RepID=UPI00131CC129|nr:cytochrome oxidase putative small subunit CydP [Rhodanobacter sp. L36]
MSSYTAPVSSSAKTSIARRPLRRLTLELLGIVVLKITVLMVIWWVAFAPHPKPDASADAIAQRLAPSSQHANAGHP